ncbi:GTPase domain-containing protein [Roseiconus lacunae]|uniref:GTPase domain-containing protein n=1 Tax=Roseiconus lacunae TaxID=2605694 RepID=UPI001E4619BA|nr:GTPase domain-containing protein [Roseiconus lacunae]MCD0461585.1 GTPase domain-containing protein [Roseiconus lacunae]
MESIEMNQQVLPSQPEGESDSFVRRVRRAATTVLGNSETGRQVRALCDEHVSARNLIAQDRAAGSLVLAVVGATGQGKSWLVRQLIRDSPMKDSIRSGNNLDQTTEQLVWVGPQPPADLDARFETYVRVSSDEMEPFGVPYLLVDAPGATDDRKAVVDVARRALSLASAIILVVRRDQIRGQTPGVLAVASEGTIVLPVVNAVADGDDAVGADVDAFVANLRTVAPTSVIARPILCDDFFLSEESEATVGARVSGELVKRLKAELENNPDSDRRRSVKLEALDNRFRAALSGLLAEKLPGLTRAVERLNEEATKLPGQVAQTLVGADGPLAAAVRSRLRLSLLTSIGAIWFPFRTVLGVLNLTSGAWDRLLLSLSGSLPSLVSTIYTSTKMLAGDRNASEEIRTGLQRRSSAAVSDRLGPLARQFRDELELLRTSDSETPSAMPGSTRSNEAQVASLSGIEALQERSHSIFEAAIEQNAIRWATPFALVGTLIFWTLMAGPFVALYKEYIAASFDSLATTGQLHEHVMERFPKPEFAMVLTSLVLSILPTAIFAMFAISAAQSKKRTGAVIEQIRDQHDEAIRSLQREGVLCLRWDEPLLSDAEFLMSAGRM